MATTTTAEEAKTLRIDFAELLSLQRPRRRRQSSLPGGREDGGHGEGLEKEKKKKKRQTYTAPAGAVRSHSVAHITTTTITITPNHSTV